jgi:LacI family transcriptional regulator
MSRHLRLPQVLLLIETSRAYGRGLVEGIARYAEERGPWSIHFEERGLGDPLPRWLRDWRGDGIISRTTRRLDMAKLLGSRLPVVELFANPGVKTPVVRPNEETIARLAAEHFFDRGLSHFAFFSTTKANWAGWRQAALERVLRQHGRECYVFHSASGGRRGGKESRPSDDRGVVRWLRQLPQPCGVLCATDLHAMQLMRSCRNCGIAVPEQIAVLGVDNDPVICGVCYPRLSSIELGSARIGYEAAALLDRMMAGGRPPSEDICVDPVEVVTRQSTDTLAIDDAEVAQAVRLIREQACRRVRVADVAEVLGLSRRVLEQRFQAALHRHPREEIIRVRMERAKMLLADTEMPVALVARESGSASLAYFSRAFRRHTGLTPREYRKRYRLSGGDFRSQRHKR